MTRPPLSCSATGPDIESTGADIIDFLTMYPDARRRVVRLLAEIDAAR